MSSVILTPCYKVFLCRIFLLSMVTAWYFSLWEYGKLKKKQIISICPGMKSWETNHNSTAGNTSNSLQAVSVSTYPENSFWKNISFFFLKKAYWRFFGPCHTTAYHKIERDYIIVINIHLLSANKSWSSLN